MKIIGVIFSALPAGFRNSDGNFVLQEAVWWENLSTDRFNRILSPHATALERDVDRRLGCSIRLVLNRP